MKKLLLIIFLSICYTNPAFAVTLVGALKEAFKSNTELNAEEKML